MTIPKPSETPAPPPMAVGEVKFSLPALLSALEHERAAGAFGMAKLDRREIDKLFKAKALRRVRTPK